MSIDDTEKEMVINNINDTHRLFKQLVHDAKIVAIDYLKKHQLDQTLPKLDSIDYTNYVNMALSKKITRRMDTWAILLKSENVITWNIHKDLIKTGNLRVIWVISEYIANFNPTHFQKLLNKLNSTTVNNYIQYKIDLPQPLEWYFDECRSIEDNLIYLG